jgi:hypothetical protein
VVKRNDMPLPQGHLGLPAPAAAHCSARLEAAAPHIIAHSATLSLIVHGQWRRDSPAR